MTDQRRISKFMSLVLRHQPERFGVELDAAGWTDVEGLLNALRAGGLEVDRALLESVVADNDKQRFALDGDRIRANQGHSVPVELGLEPMSPPAELFHGTVGEAVEAILTEGLRPMARHHVHLSVDVATATRVGARRGTPIVLRVDSAAMAAAGFEFMRSENGVWLVEHVPPTYLSRT